MDLIFLLDRINTATTLINSGRKGFATRGKAEEGRLFYEEGISMGMSAFKDAQSTRDPYTIILAEYSFLALELQFCDKADTDNYNSLIQGIQYFDDAFIVLQLAEGKTNYHFVDKAIPHNKKYRVKGFPKDSFHIAITSHITRINNTLRASGIDLIEKALLKQRRENMLTVKKAYTRRLHSRQYNKIPIVQTPKGFMSRNRN